MEDENTRLENDYNATNAALKNVTEKYHKLEDENRNWEIQRIIRNAGGEKTQ